MKNKLIPFKLSVGIAITWILVPAFANAEAGFRPPWTCRSVDKQQAESMRSDYFTSLQQAALDLLDHSQIQAEKYLAMYTKDPYRFDAGHPDRQAARLQRENFRKLSQLQRMLQDRLDFYENASIHAYHAQMGINGVLSWSANYPEDAKQQVIEILNSLEPYGFVVARGEQRLSGESVDLMDGHYYIDVDMDLDPFVRLVPGSGDWDCRQQNRLFQIEATVKRDYQRVKALLDAAKMPMPVLEMQVPGDGLWGTYIDKPTVAEIAEAEKIFDCAGDENQCLESCAGLRDCAAEKQDCRNDCYNLCDQTEYICRLQVIDCLELCEDDSTSCESYYNLANCEKDCTVDFDSCQQEESQTRINEEYDFWKAMWRSLDQIQKNIIEERWRIRELTVNDINQLAEMSLVRMQVLAEHPEYEGIDCLVTEQIGLDEIALNVGKGLCGLVGVGFALTGHPYISYGFYAAGTLLQFVDTARLFFEYRQTEEEYFTAVFGQSLVPRELLQQSQTSFQVSLGTSLVSAVFTVNQGWHLYKLALAKRTHMAMINLLFNKETYRSMDAKTLAGLLGITDDFDLRQFTAIVEAARVKLPDQAPATIQALLKGFAEAKPFVYGNTRTMLSWKRMIGEVETRLGPGHIGEFNAQSPLDFARALGNNEIAKQLNQKTMDYMMVVMKDGTTRYLSSSASANFGYSIADMTQNEEIIAAGIVGFDKAGAITGWQDFAVKPPDYIPTSGWFPAGVYKYPALIDVLDAATYGRLGFNIESAYDIMYAFLPEVP